MVFLQLVEELIHRKERELIHTSNGHEEGEVFSWAEASLSVGSQVLVFARFLIWFMFEAGREMVCVRLVGGHSSFLHNNEACFSQRSIELSKLSGSLSISMLLAELDYAFLICWWLRRANPRSFPCWTSIDLMHYRSINHFFEFVDFPLKR